MLTKSIITMMDSQLDEETAQTNARFKQQEDQLQQLTTAIELNTACLTKVDASKERMNSMELEMTNMKQTLMDNLKQMMMINQQQTHQLITNLLTANQNDTNNKNDNNKRPHNPSLDKKIS